MKTQHTKGEWIARGQGGLSDGGSSKMHPCFKGRIETEAGDTIISNHSFLGVVGKTPEEAEANAKLIAAAPELLEASIKMSKAISTGNHELLHEANLELKTAIKKATS